MGRRLIIIGAGGHGKVCADNAVKNGYTDISFIDDNIIGSVMGFPIIGTCSEIMRLNDSQTDFVIGLGNNATREFIAEKFSVNWATLIHPSAQIANGVSVGTGSVVMACAVVNSDAKIGKHCIINSNAIVEHDNIIEDYVHLSPGAKLSGTVIVGKRTWVGTGTSIINNISICPDVVIGVGSVVIRDIESPGVYYGLINKHS